MPHASALFGYHQAVYSEPQTKLFSSQVAVVFGRVSSLFALANRRLDIAHRNFTSELHSNFICFTFIYERFQMPRSWRTERLVSESWIGKDVKERKRRDITLMWLRITTKKLGHNSWRPNRVSKGRLPTQGKTYYRLIELIHRFSTVVNEFLFILCLFNDVFSY